MEKCLLCEEQINNKFNYSHIFHIGDEFMCEKCLTLFERVKSGCVRCGKKTKDIMCSDCRYWENYELTKMFKIINYSLFYYNEIAKSIVRKIKFTGDLKLIYAFKTEIQLFIKKYKFKDIALIPVPLHSERLGERGFNQSLYIAKLLRLPILDVLVKLNNEKQSKKTKAKRMEFTNLFEIKQGISLENKRVMIVDDIYTTGATIHQIGRILYEKKVKEMLSFTLFRS